MKHADESAAAFSRCETILGESVLVTSRERVASRCHRQQHPRCSAALVGPDSSKVPFLVQLADALLHSVGREPEHLGELLPRDAPR